MAGWAIEAEKEDEAGGFLSKLNGYWSTLSGSRGDEAGTTAADGRADDLLELTNLHELNGVFDSSSGKGKSSSKETRIFLAAARGDQAERAEHRVGVAGLAAFVARGERADAPAGESRRAGAGAHAGRGVGGAGLGGPRDPLSAPARPAPTKLDFKVRAPTGHR